MSDQPVNPSDDDRYVPTDSPRLGAQERLRRLGVRSLSSTDLLGLVIGSPSAAQTLVRRHGLPGLADLPPTSWRQQPGIGQATSARLSAVFELGRRVYATSTEAARPRLTRPADVFKQVRHIGSLKKEHLIGLYLDAQNGLAHMETVSVGSLNTTRTHPREILHPAIVHLALGFILAHNHPSGSLDPSDEDIAFSRAVHRAGEIVGIELYDHLIVTANGYTSLRERGAR
jgi:DNA repair protein RadC